MTITLNKWGNSIGLRLPSNIVQSFDLEPGSKAEIEIEKERIIIKPSPKDMTLAWLCEGMKMEEGHEEHFPDFVGEEKFWESE